MKSRHLQRYLQLPQAAAFSHSKLRLCSVGYGHPAYIDRLRAAVDSAAQRSERVVLHVLSGSSWYAMSYLDQYKPSNVCGLVLDSTPYKFDNLLPLARELLPAAIAGPSCALVDAVVRLHGASDEWRRHYLDVIENPPVDNVLVIGSQQDSMIPTNQFEELHERLQSNCKRATLFVSTNARHAMAVKDDADRYNAVYKQFVQEL